nr:hypothetical protein [Tanacetum cinerariifolium]
MLYGNVIESGNSFVSATQTTTTEGGDITITISIHVTAEEKIKRKNDMKARSMLLIALSNEQLMTFNQYKDAKCLFDAIETKLGGFKRFGVCGDAAVVRVVTGCCGVGGVVTVGRWCVAPWFWRWSDGSGEAAAMVVVRGVASAVARGEVAARDIVDRVDRKVGKLFGFAEKSPPENFSGGGGAVAGGGCGEGEN